MKESEVRDMARNGVYENAVLNGKVEETHISWVILTRKYAIKIKKPIKLSFLDFSTLELRQELCEKELRLNSRFTDIYLAVLPICVVDKQWIIGKHARSEPLEWCVVMRRMAISKRLDNVLRKKVPGENTIKALAAEIAFFHNKADKVFTPFEIEQARNIFNDIWSIIEFAKNNIDVQFGEIILRSIDWNDAFLKEHSARFQERIHHGLKRDIHGDLHCRNIFLYAKPILFDCIEFNDQYRQIDVLYEMAFLCMDLERFRQRHLSDLILKEYRRYFPALQTKEDHKLLIYYKALRATIRAKVHALQWQQAENESEASFQISEARNYLSLMDAYMANMNSLSPF